MKEKIKTLSTLVLFLFGVLGLIFVLLIGYVVWISIFTRTLLRGKTLFSVFFGLTLFCSVILLMFLIKKISD